MSFDADGVDPDRVSTLSSSRLGQFPCAADGPGAGGSRRDVPSLDLRKGLNLPFRDAWSTRRTPIRLDDVLLGVDLQHTLIPTQAFGFSGSATMMSK